LPAAEVTPGLEVSPRASPAAEAPSMPGFDAADPQLIEDPYPAFAALRELGPVWHSEAAARWAGGTHRWAGHGRNTGPPAVLQFRGCEHLFIR
jgi:hypothetical protein